MQVKTADCGKCRTEKCATGKCKTWKMKEYNECERNVTHKKGRPVNLQKNTGSSV